MGGKMDTRQLNAALLAAFDTSSLKRLVKTAFNEDLDQITQGKNYQETVFELVKWAERTGRLNMMLISASQANPDNPKIKELLEATFADPGAASPVYFEQISRYGSTNEVANDSYMQHMIELNRHISELSYEVKGLTIEMAEMRSWQRQMMAEVPLRSPISKTTERIFIGLLVILVVLGIIVTLQLMGVLG